MKLEIEEYWFVGILLMIAVFVTYIIYVDSTATRTPGCHYMDSICLKSHIEKSERYYGKRWNTIETEVCDSSEQIEVPCDCITRHYFWGDKKDF